MVSSREFSGHLAGLNPEQAAAVYHRGSPLLVVAGPGSGKTRVLTHRITSLVKDGVSPHRILAVTFTNKAAAEMRHRLSALLPPSIPVPASVSTFHSFCVRSLRANADALSVARNFSVLDADDSLRAFMSANEDLDKEDAKAFLSTISFAKNSLSSTDAFLSGHTPSEQKIGAAWERYDRKLRELGALDFDDLLLETRRLLSTSLGDDLRSKFDSVLVDEWQDTNLVQYDIVKMLAGSHPGSKDVAVVGDPEQSIYGWRGSTPEVVGMFLSDFAPCTVVKLGLNYRSTPRIVAVSAAIAAASTASAKAELTALPDASPGSPVRVISYADPEHEAKSVVSELRRKSGTCAVLVRTKAQTRAFEQSLLRAGIKYNLVGASSFAARTEVKDTLSYLRLLLNPAAALDFRRAATVPRRKLGETALESFLKASSEAGLPPGLALMDEDFINALPSRTRPGLLAFSATMRSLADLVGQGPASCVRFVLGSGLRSFYSSDPERLENLDELLAAADTLEAEMGSSSEQPSGQEMLERFVENMSLASASDAAEASPISVITAHASKGREFDHVWVVGAEEKVFPHSMSFSSPSEIEEERRLFFVAVSRARLGLTITHRRRHFIMGDWSDTDPSRFIELLEPLAHAPDPGLLFESVYDPDQNLYSKYGSPRSGKGSYPSGNYRGKSTPARKANPAPSRTPGSPSPQPSKAPQPRLDPSLVSPGMVVSHDVFGPGTVIALTGNMASIEFSGKTRVLDLSFAPLKPA